MIIKIDAIFKEEKLSMKNNKKYYSIIFPLVITLMIALLLFQGTDVRSKNHQNFQNQLAQKSVTGASNELHLYINELRRSIRLFAAQEQILIRHLANNQSDEYRYEQLKYKVSQHFPEYFSFTIASKDGLSLLKWQDELVGDGCKKDIAQFSKNTDSHRVYVHSSPLDNPYHFDLMVPWGDKEGIFFISFNLKNITQILMNAETVGHNLLLLKNNEQATIEVTSQGSTKAMMDKGELSLFNNLDSMGMKNNFNLSYSNKESIEYESSVDGTLWMLVDIPNINLYSSYNREIKLQHSGVFILFLFVISVMTHFLYQANKKLFNTVSDLHATNQQKDKLLSIIGHDLKSSFTPIQYYSTSLIKNAKKYSPEEVINRASSINESSDHALELLDKLLIWAKLHSDGYPITIENVHVFSIVENSVSLYSIAALEKGCTLRNESNDVIVRAAPHALDTIIRNLVNNAIKFSQGGVITIGTTVAKDTVSIYVTDFGQGMDEETCRKVLSEDDYSTSVGTSGEKGSGLGLALCLGLAAKQNGIISVESVIGERTTFQLTLPKGH